MAPHTPLQPYYDYFPQGRGFQPAAAPEPAGYEYASSDHLYTSQQQPQVYGAPLPPYGRAAAGPARAPSGSTAASSSHLINGYWMPQQGTWPGAWREEEELRSSMLLRRRQRAGAVALMMWVSQDQAQCVDPLDPLDPRVGLRPHHRGQQWQRGALSYCFCQKHHPS